MKDASDAVELIVNVIVLAVLLMETLLMAPPSFGGFPSATLYGWTVLMRTAAKLDTAW